MGLDQYLRAKYYASPAEWRGEEANKTFNKVIEAVNAQDFVVDDLPSVEVSVMVGYWRKANAIHGWFVRNVQHNEDDCREYGLVHEDLVELRRLCTQVLEDNSLAEDLLPTMEGFFFGGTKYDQYYFGDLIYTVKLIDNLLASVPAGWDFYYQSSW